MRYNYKKNDMADNDSVDYDDIIEELLDLVFPNDEDRDAYMND